MKVGHECWSPHDKTMWAKWKIMKYDQGFKVTIKNIETNEVRDHEFLESSTIYRILSNYPCSRKKKWTFIMMHVSKSTPNPQMI